MASRNNKVIFDILANTKQYAKGMDQTVDLTSAATKAMQLGFVALTAVVTGSTIAFANFEKRLSNVSTLIDETVESMDTIGQSILDTAKNIPKPVSELVDSMYDIRSAGIDAADAVDTLKNSGKLAVAGLASTTQATDLLTTAMNTFKAEGRSSAEIADILFKTVKFGKNKVSELAQSFGQTAPLAKDAGVSLIEFSAATAALTSTGIPASVAQNSIRAAMVGLNRQTKDMRKVFNKLGYKDIRQLINNSDNLGEAFVRIKTTADELGIPINKVTGRVEGAVAITSIATATNEMYNKSLKSMTTGTNLIDEAFSKQTKTLAAVGQSILNLSNIAMINLGGRFRPAMVELGTVVLGVLDAINNKITQSGSDITKTFSMFVGAGINIFNILKNVASGFGEIFQLLSGWKILQLFAVGVNLAASALLLIAKGFKTTAKGANDLLTDMGELGTVLKVVMGVMVAWKAVAFATYLYGIVTATKAWALATRLVNAAMASNPIGLLLVGLAALVVALYDVRVNLNEWKLSFQKWVNAIIIGWKKARKIFAGDETEKRLDKEIAALQKENAMIEAQTKALKKRKAELKAQGVGSYDADRQAGKELDQGKLDKEVNAYKAAEEAKTQAKKEGLAERSDAETNHLLAAKMQKDDAALKDKVRETALNEQLLALKMENGFMEREAIAAQKEESYQSALARERQFQQDKLNYGITYAKINKQMNEFYDKQQVKSFQQNSGNLTRMADSKNKTLAGIGKTAAIAQVAMDTPRAAMGAYAALAGIPFVGPALGIAAAAAAIAYGAEQIGRIKSQSYAVGTDYISEDMMANVHKGEGIIPAKSNQFLQSGKLALVSPDALGGGRSGQGGSESTEIDVNLNIKDNLMDWIEAQVVRRRTTGRSII